MKHKTPWSIADYGDDGKQIFDCNGYFIGKHMDAQTSAHIVHCVNNFEALVDNLETMVARFGNYYVNGSDILAVNNARAILAKCKGE